MDAASAILAADACEASGLEVPALSVATREKLSAFLPPEARADDVTIVDARVRIARPSA